MKWKFMAKTVAFLYAFLGVKEIPISAENSEVAFTAEQETTLKAKFGDDYVEKMKAALNKELAEMHDDSLELKAIQDEIDAMVQESGMTAEELEKIAKDEKGDKSLSATIKAISEKQKEHNALFQKLIAENIEDSPEAIIKRTEKNMTHSATHLFASGKSYDAFEGGRSWNTRLRDGGIKATDFNSNGTIPLLQKDLEHFVEENNGQLESLFNDFRGLPAQWDTRSGVLDRVSDGYIIPAEIVQGRAKGWSPKNKFKIASESGQVYRKKIDITFSGYELQEIENTWIRQYNKADGSHPWKMSFIGFLLGELIKVQMLDDRNAQINGIYVQSPDADDMPGAAVNSQNGLRYLWYYFRDVKQQYRAFDIGAPTEANIVDHINTMIEMMPEIERKEQGLEVQLSSKWYKAYLKRAGELHPVVINNAIDQTKTLYQSNTVINYPNIILQELVDQTHSDFIGITQSKNIQVLEYNVSEKGKFTVSHEKRDTHVFADYRLGIRIKFVGTKLAEGDPRSFELQKVWSNNMPVFGNDVFVPAFDDTSGILKVSFPNIQVDSTWKTNITAIEGATKGSVVRIKGNTGLAASKNLVDGAGLDLASNFDLSLGGTIVLFVKPDGTFKEINRTTVPEVAITTDIDFNTAVLDSKGGSVFRFTGVADTTLTNILNGVEGKTIKIYGTDTTDIELTVADVATKIDVASNAVLADSNDYIQLTYVNGVWVETERSITA